MRDIPQTEFDRILRRIVSMGVVTNAAIAGQLLAIPSVYRALAAYWRDEVFRTWRRECALCQTTPKGERP